MQVVEAVEEHRVGPPARRCGPQRVECAPRVQLVVDSAEPFELAGVAPVQGRHLTRERRPPGIVAGPRPERLGKPLRGHERAPKLGDELACGRHESGRPRDPPE